MRAIELSIVNLQMPENTELKDYGRLLKDGELKIRVHGEGTLRVHERGVRVLTGRKAGGPTGSVG